MNKLKRIMFLIVFIYALLKIFDLITSPHINIFNKTDAPIRFNSLQYVETGEEPTTEELNDWKLSYKIEEFKSKKMMLYTKHRFEDKDLYFGMDYLYFGNYLTDKNMDDLVGVTFMSQPDYVGQSAYCAFKVEVYPNRKTVVTPTRKWGCIRPMYYHESSQ